MNITENINLDSPATIFREIEADNEREADKMATRIAEYDYPELKNMGWNLVQVYSSDTLGFSSALEDSTDRRLESLNESIMKEDFIKNNFNKVEFYFDDISLLVSYELNNGFKGKEEFTSEVDSGAIEIYPDHLNAYFGTQKYLEIQEELDNQGGVFKHDFIAQYETRLLEQLSQQYLLSCAPDTEGGSEFEDYSRTFLKN